MLRRDSAERVYLIRISPQSLKSSSTVSKDTRAGRSNGDHGILLRLPLSSTVSCTLPPMVQTLFSFCSCGGHSKHYMLCSACFVGTARRTPERTQSFIVWHSILSSGCMHAGRRCTTHLSPSSTWSFTAMIRFEADSWRTTTPWYVGRRCGNFLARHTFLLSASFACCFHCIGSLFTGSLFFSFHFIAAALQPDRIHMQPKEEWDRPWVLCARQGNAFSLCSRMPHPYWCTRSSPGPDLFTGDTGNVLGPHQEIQVLHFN